MTRRPTDGPPRSCCGAADVAGPTARACGTPRRSGGSLPSNSFPIWPLDEGNTGWARTRRQRRQQVLATSVRDGATYVCAGLLFTRVPSESRPLRSAATGGHSGGGGCVAVMPTALERDHRRTESLRCTLVRVTLHTGPRLRTRPDTWAQSARGYRG